MSYSAIAFEIHHQQGRTTGYSLPCVPTIKISKELSKDINPMYAEYFNQFHWLPE
jgi:hypothetical protein